jgi:hypothetical protein
VLDLLAFHRQASSIGSDESETRPLWRLTQNVVTITADKLFSDQARHLLWPTAVTVWVWQLSALVS